MVIFIGNKNFTEGYVGNKKITEIWKGNEKVRPNEGITLTIDHTKVSDDLTNFPVVVNLNDVKSGITLTEAQSIRIYKADGTTELPRDIVTKDKMRFKADLSSSNDTVFKIKMDGVSSDYGVSDTYGRNNVYTKYKAFYDFASGNSNDRTGNGYNGTDTSISYSDGGAYFNGSGYITLSSLVFSGHLTQGYLSFYINKWEKNSPRQDQASLFGEYTSTGSTGDTRNYTHIDTSTGKYFFNQYRSSSSIFVLDTNSSVSDNGTDYHLATLIQSSTTQNYFNGASSGSSTGIINYTGASPSTATIGRRRYTEDTYRFKGNIASIGLSDKSGFPSSRVSTEYNNQSSPSTFYTIS